jgi:hypothetical protein
MPPRAGGILDAIVEAISFRNLPGAAEVIVSAIEHPLCPLKEWYAAYLEWMGREDLIVPTLLRVLEARQREPGRDVPFIIDTLRYRLVDSALDAVLPFLYSEDEHTQGAAVAYLWNNDESPELGAVLEGLMQD